MIRLNPLDSLWIDRHWSTHQFKIQWFLFVSFSDCRPWQCNLRDRNVCGSRTFIPSLWNPQISVGCKTCHLNYSTQNNMTRQKVNLRNTAWFRLRWVTARKSLRAMFENVHSVLEGQAWPSLVGSVQCKSLVSSEYGLVCWKHANKNTSPAEWQSSRFLRCR
jgi:hypothetical protein